MLNTVNFRSFRTSEADIIQDFSKCPEKKGLNLLILDLFDDPRMTVS